LSTATLATRLVFIIHKLSHGEILNIKELSTEFLISERQAQKDILLFSTIYEIESLGQQNYRLKSGFKVLDASNEDTEIALALLKSLQHSALPQMNEYIDEAIPETREYKNIFVLSIDYEDILHKKEFYKLLQAIKTQESCSFNYTKKDGSSKKVHIHPYRIANFSNFWYLLAYDVEAQKLKSYHINSIESVEFAGENYISNVAIEKEIEDTFAKFNSVWFDGNLKSVELELVANAKLYAQRNLSKNSTVISQDDETLTISFEYYNSAEVLSFVKGWLPDIKIIDNKPLEDELKELMQRYLQSI
jgi:predicted DNA-binding transcriptional regulator YafY